MACRKYGLHVGVRVICLPINQLGNVHPMRHGVITRVSDDAFVVNCDEDTYGESARHYPAIYLQREDGN